MNSFIVKGNIVWSESNKDLKSVENGFLVIKDGIVEGVFSSLPDEYKGYELVDAGNDLVVPGFGGSSCPCTAVCIQRNKYGLGAYGLAQHIYFP